MSIRVEGETPNSETKGWGYRNDFVKEKESYRGQGGAEGDGCFVVAGGDGERYRRTVLVRG